jgi:NADPH:quinone reductase-like Zn-dependent oxidoreductase
MRAVRLHDPGGVAALEIEEVAVPSAASGEALVRVHAAAITRDELEWPLDRLPAIPSFEVSGVVADVAADVAEPAVDTAVYGLVPFDRDGAAAEYVAVPAAALARAPGNLSHPECASIPMPALTAWQGLVDHGRLEAGERVLITGAAGGVGHLAMQLARERGATVVEAARSGDTVEPVDLVFDTAGGEVLVRAAAALRDGGRLVSVAEEPPTSLRRDIEASYFVVESDAEQLARLTRLADAGTLRVEIDSVFPLAEARAAFERVQARGKRGKVVLQIHA